MGHFWDDQIRKLGRNTLYVDTGAILGCVERGKQEFNDFFKSSVGFRYITSTYVVAETVRRLVKTKTPNQFCGPAGERCIYLSHYILSSWLAENDVYVICLPPEQFDEAKDAYQEKHTVKCDLIDVISYTIVTRLERDQILSPDAHFCELGLTLLP